MTIKKCDLKKCKYRQHKLSREQLNKITSYLVRLIFISREAHSEDLAELQKFFNNEWEKFLQNNWGE